MAPEIILKKTYDAKEYIDWLFYRYLPLLYLGTLVSVPRFSVEDFFDIWFKTVKNILPEEDSDLSWKQSDPPGSCLIVSDQVPTYLPTHEANKKKERGRFQLVGTVLVFLLRTSDQGLTQVLAE